MVRVVHLRSKIMKSTVKYTMHLNKLVTNRMDFSIPGCVAPQKEDRELVDKICIKFNLNPVNDSWLIERLVAKAKTPRPLA